MNTHGDSRKTKTSPLESLSTHLLESHRTKHSRSRFINYSLFQIWLKGCFYTACELRGVFTFYMFNKTKTMWETICSLHSLKYSRPFTEKVCLTTWIQMARFIQRWGWGEGKNKQYFHVFINYDPCEEAGTVVSILPNCYCIPGSLVSARKTPGVW